jgi:adenylyltransferase/sulfurtransferase
MALGANDQQVASIPAEEVKRELEAGARLFVLDVRDPHELKEELGHIRGATNIPVGTLAHRLSELEPHRGQEIVTVCKAGGRAHTAAQILMQAGFPRVHVMMGGMMSWKEAGFPTGA